MRLRFAAFAFLLLLGACAHAPQAASLPSSPERTVHLDADLPAPDSASRIAARAAPTRTTEPAPRGMRYDHFELPVHYNERVHEYVELYSQRRRTTFTSWLERMGRYRNYIEQKLDSLGLPRELIYVPLIESAYEANTASPMAAAGLWQFMKGTARSEGLEVSEYVDERRDPFRSTDAALQHFSSLYRQFNSWYLTFAAYNSGSSRVARLLKERGLPKQDSVYWELLDALPKETRDYVPMLLGAAIVGENAAVLGLDPVPEPAIRFDEVSVPGATTLKAVARAAGVDLEEVATLNPQLIKLITPPGRRTRVRIPQGTAARFTAAFTPAAARAAAGSH